jgi:DNA-binding MarR family transcriptional regulator
MLLISIVIMLHVAIDDYVLDVLLPDLAGHDRSPAAFLIYVVLWTKLYRSEQRCVALSLQQLGELAGLSKSAVQAAIRLLKRRGLIRITKVSATSVPQYELIRHWIRRRAKNARNG